MTGWMRGEPAAVGNRPGAPPVAAFFDVAEVLQAAGLSVPAGWQAVDRRRASHDGRAVTVVRWAPGAERTLGGQHVSVVVDDLGVLLGWTRMTPEVADRPIPDAEQARAAAFGWLAGFASEHARALEVLWVRQHDETVRDDRGVRSLIRGAKVKTRQADGRYTWVVMDGRDAVLTYERDVRWDGVAGRRGTEMWLHDSWVAAREGSGPQPPAPYALV
jgi:hypothetical protein